MAEKMGVGEVKLPSPTTTTVKMSVCRRVNLKQDKCGGEYENGSVLTHSLDSIHFIQTHRDIH